MGKASLTIFRPNQPGKLSRRLSRNFWKNMLVKSLPSTFTRFKRWTRPAGRPWMKSFPATPASPFERRGKKDGFHHRGAARRSRNQSSSSCSCSKRGGINWTGFVCPLRSACLVGRRSCGDALRATIPRPAMGRASLPTSQLSSRSTVAQRERLD